jgi:hypothetical protein
LKSLCHTDADNIHNNLGTLLVEVIASVLDNEVSRPYDRGDVSFLSSKFVCAFVSVT